MIHQTKYVTKPNSKTVFELCNAQKYLSSRIVPKLFWKLN